MLFGKTFSKMEKEYQIKYCTKGDKTVYNLEFTDLKEFAQALASLTTNDELENIQIAIFNDIIF